VSVDQLTIRRLVHMRCVDSALVYCLILESGDERRAREVEDRKVRLVQAAKHEQMHVVCRTCCMLNEQRRAGHRTGKQARLLLKLGRDRTTTST
jgi:hypothetical protein